MASPTITYTPNGIPRQPGYFDPKNPYDTGRAGERNAELGGGGKNTMSGWDYDRGAPRAGAVQQGDGVWVLPGQSSGGSGGGGGGIPGGALIAQAQLAAKARFQQRLADITKKRQSTARTGGYQFDVGDDGLVQNWRVDPYNQYGQFQLLNRAQAAEGYNVVGQNIDRGLGTGGGLAAQNMDNARFLWGQQDAALGQSLVDQLGALDEEQQQAKYEMDRALWEAQLEALRMAAQGGDYGYGGGDWGYEEPVDDPITAAVAKAAKARYPGLPKAMQPVKVGGQWHGAWGPAPTAVMKKVIATTKKVTPILPKPVTKPSTTLTPAKVAALNKAAVKPKPPKKK